MTPEIRQKPLEKNEQIEDRLAASESVHKGVINEAELAVPKLNQNQLEDDL